MALLVTHQLKKTHCLKILELLPKLEQRGFRKNIINNQQEKSPNLSTRAF